MSVPAPAGGRSLPLWPLVILILLLVVASFAIGQFPVSVHDLLKLTFGKLFGPSQHESPLIATVVLEIRLPRVLGALLVGGALSAAGAAYQGMFRNPLVSPDILGVSAGAGLGAVLGIFLSLPAAGIQALAFLLGLAAVAIVYAISSRLRGNDPVLVLVLAGVVIGSLVGALISLLKIIADPYDQLPAITFWLLGSLANIDAGDIKLALPVVLLSVLPLYLLRWRMNLLSLHDEESRALGADTTRLRIVFIAAATLMTSAVVAIGGMVGWVGLVMPHIARMLVGPEFGRLLPASMLLGAGFLLLVDNVARSITSSEIPLGIVTALIGAPFFLWLLAAGRRPWR
ncbi:MAG: iron ABC transporter permease [Gammaproteobacteria bacterium]|nr:iron ABC transporter permease [Gammaproteobacteria bacterium]